MVNWDKFKPEEISENLKYFCDYWEYICDKLESPDVCYSFMSPHYLVLQIIDEIESSGFLNKSIKKYFNDNAHRYFVKNSYLNEELYPLWSILIKELEKNRPVFLGKICLKLRESFESNLYFENMFNALEKEVLNKNRNDNNRLLNALTEVIVFEFYFKGYSVDSIKQIIKNIFSDFNIVTNDNIEIVKTCYPHNINYKSFNNLANYNRALKDFMNNLSIEMRVHEILNIFKKNKEKYYFILPVTGLYTDRKIEFANLIFYNPKKEKMLKCLESNLSPDEDFGINYDNNANALIEVNCIDIEVGYEEAKKQISNVCNLFRSNYSHASPIKVFETSYIVADKNYIFYASHNNGFQKDSILKVDLVAHKDDMLKQLDIFKNLNDNGIIKYEDKVLIIDSLYFFQQGLDNQNNEIKLLNYWISLENLFANFKPDILDQNNNCTKFDQISLFVSKFIAYRNIYHFGWEVYYYIDKLQRNIHRSFDCVYSDLILPEKLIEEANLTPQNIFDAPDKTYLYKFIDSIDEIIKINNKRPLANILLNDIKQFYTDNKMAEKILKDKESIISNELLLIYRLKNKIVHNANYNGNFLKYHVIQLEDIIHTVLLYLEDIFSKVNNTTTIQDAFINNYIEEESFIEKLKTNESFTLYNMLKEE